MPIKPTKLNTAAKANAVPGFMHRVETAVAIAFGASVAPAMRVTPITSAKMTPNVGYVAI